MRRLSRAEAADLAARQPAISPWRVVASQVLVGVAVAALVQLVSELPYVVVYTPKERDYFCVEPVSHLNNAIHMAEPAAHGLVALAPGATLEAAMRLDVAVV